MEFTISLSDILTFITGLLTGSGMQTMMMVAIQVESIKAMTKHRESLLESFKQHLRKEKDDFNFEISLATKSMSNEIKKNTIKYILRRFFSAFTQ